MSDPVAAVVRDAEWLAHRYDPGHDAIQFRRVTREQHRRATFLTDAALGGEVTPTVIARADAIAAGPPQAPIHFVFHSAFCCSTLVARAFELPGRSMGLKEPVILNDIVGWRQRGEARGPAIARALDHAMALLARPFAAGEAVIVKPSNLINGLATGMLALRPEAHAVLMYAPLDIYLRSVAKKEMEGRLWVRDLLVKLLGDGLVDLGFADADYLMLTDLQVAAVGWLAQHALFGRLAMAHPARVRTLDSETLLAQPSEAIAGLAQLFGLSLSERDVARVVDGPAFKRHSKTKGVYSPDARIAEYDQAATLHADELHKVSVWARAVGDAAGVAMTLPAALLT